MPDARINTTMQTFGYPATVVAEYSHWVVLLRPLQATLGALVLIARGDATQFSGLSSDAIAEMHPAIGDIEVTLKALFSYDKINYLMLMMVDPDVHFHVIPRYSSSKIFAGHDFSDPGWPRLPDLGYDNAIDDPTRQKMIAHLHNNWPKR
jgi:diadenosine tetraphosphate (Ap4A) HIT family hydrolase